MNTTELMFNLNVGGDRQVESTSTPTTVLPLAVVVQPAGLPLALAVKARAAGYYRISSYFPFR
jgi:hypothetical protein